MVRSRVSGKYLQELTVQLLLALQSGPKRFVPFRFGIDSLTGYCWNLSFIRNKTRRPKGQKGCAAAGCFRFSAERNRLSNGVGDHPRPGPRGANGSAGSDDFPSPGELRFEQIRNKSE